MNEPLVIAHLSNGAAASALAAGFEEEGVPLTVSHAQGTPEALAREAAHASLLGIGIGGDGDRLVLVLAGGPASPYLEARVSDARSFAHDAARIAARRPLTLG